MIRLFLAFVVAIDHLRQFVLKPTGLDIPEWSKLGMNAGFAVMLFYVISGFLISTGLSRKYEPTANGTARFYESRFTRIFSLYWPMVLVAFILVPNAWTAFVAAPVVDEITGIVLFGVDWRVAFTIQPGVAWSATVQGLAQAWTLGAELAFYLVAPFLLRSAAATLIVFTASLGTRAFLVHKFGFAEAWTYLFLPATFLFFLLGHFARVAAERWSPLLNPRLGLGLLAMAVAALTVGDYATWDSPRFWIAVLCFAAALPSIFRATSGSRMLNAMADLSYPVYLVHVIVLLVLRQSHAFTGFTSAAGACLFFLAMTVIAAIAAHWLLEKPATVVLRWLLQVIRPVQASATLSSSASKSSVRAA